MPLTAQQKRSYRRIAHHLAPVVTISENGASEGALAELDRALSDHELIKVRLAHPDRAVRAELSEMLCQHSKAELVQRIGRILVLFRKSRQPDPKLSNLLRAQPADHDVKRRG